MAPKRLAYWKSKDARHYFVDPLEATGKGVYCLVSAANGAFTMHECVSEEPDRVIEDLTRFQFGLVHGCRNIENH